MGLTECERIIEQRILPASFFDDEIRSGFVVSKERKKIWGIEIDLYLKFAEVCKKHHLKYWGDGGTLLGAVRHNGFIPWDDDMDLIMPRVDYDCLMKVGVNEFHDQYFLQNPHTDPNYGYSFAKLRNSNTTCVPKVFLKAGFNHGIHIDIFPLDEICLDSFEYDKKRINDCIMRCSSYMKRNSVNQLDERQLDNYHKYWTDDPSVEYDEIQRIASNPANRGSGLVANCTITRIQSKAQIWEAKWFEKTIMHSFESIDIPMPREIDKRLSTQYGDYMQLPPVEERTGWHSNVIWDPDRPYSDYL